jgi:PA14 domain
MPEIEFRLSLSKRELERWKRSDHSKTGHSWSTTVTTGTILLWTVVIGIAVYVFGPSPAHMLVVSSKPAKGQMAMATTSSFGQPVRIPSALEGKVYVLPQNTDQLPDFDKLHSVGKLYTTELNVSQHTFNDLLPGLPKDVQWFGIVYTGRFEIERTARYHVEMIVGHGARLSFDDRVVIEDVKGHDPDPQHPDKSDLVLKRGQHRLRLEYFRAPYCTVALVLKMAPEGEELLPFQIEP